MEGIYGFTILNENPIHLYIPFLQMKLNIQSLFPLLVSLQSVDSLTD